MMWFQKFTGRGDYGIGGAPGLRGQLGEKVLLLFKLKHQIINPEFSYNLKVKLLIYIRS